MLPEADHNEVVGWAAARSLGPFSYVSLEDPGAHPRNALRAELTAEIAGAGAVARACASTRAATSPVERLVSLVLLGDLVTIYAAVLRGADPVDIGALDGLKAALRARHGGVLRTGRRVLASYRAGPCPPSPPSPLPGPRARSTSPPSSVARRALTLPAAR